MNAVSMVATCAERQENQRTGRVHCARCSAITPEPYRAITPPLCATCALQREVDG